MGVWDTSWGDLTLRQEGGRITGDYAEDNGEFYGKIDGEAYAGYWIEDDSNERCSTAKNGRYYWGRFVITFDFDAGKFTTEWGYCDGELSRSDWSGTRKSGPPPAEPSPAPVVEKPKPGPVTGVWETGWGDLTLRQEGDRVTGSYSEDNGEVYGEIQGDMFLGYWIEDDSAERCSDSRHGRRYWGRFKMKMDFDAGKFTGDWGYCDGELSRSDWNGTKK